VQRITPLKPGNTSFCIQTNPCSNNTIIASSEAQPSASEPIILLLAILMGEGNMTQSELSLGSNL
jgi:hypothetical protein